MATVEIELTELRARVAQLEQVVRELFDTRQPVLIHERESLSDQEQLLPELKAEGIIRDPTPEERVLAAEWDALPEDEKQTHIRLMNSLVLTPSLSQIVIESRR